MIVVEAEAKGIVEVVMLLFVIICFVINIYVKSHRILTVLEFSV